MGRPKLSPYGICKVSVASLRQLPNHRSYLVSQILFGEYVEIISKKNKDWFRVACKWDGTQGWIDPKQFYVLKESEANKISDCTTFSLDHLYGLASDKATIPISLGSNLYNCDGLNVRLPFGKFQYRGQIVDLKQSMHSCKLLQSIARRFIHCPYLFGGRSILGVDAAGFMQVIYKMVGVELERYSRAQAKQGHDIGFSSSAMAGDLAFFQSNEGLIDHVGMILEDGQIIHAYGQVRIDVLDQQGIFNKEKKRYSHKLRTIRRMIL